KDPALLAEFKRANQAVIDALHSYESFLKNDLLPRSSGDFRIGAENYRKKLLYDEMVEIPLDRLMEVGRENLRKNQAEFQEVARKIDPARPAQAILDEAQADHPSAGGLLQSFKDVLSGLRSFIEK